MCEVESLACQCTQSLQPDNCFSVGVCLNHREVFDQTICIFLEQTFFFQIGCFNPNGFNERFSFN